MKKIGSYLMLLLISIILCIAFAFVLSELTALSFEAGVLGTATVWLLIGFLDFSKRQQGIVVGVGNQQNPLSSSVIASLNTNVETTERSIDLDRINNAMQPRKKLYKLFIDRTTIQGIIIGLTLLTLAFTIYFNDDATNPPTDELLYDNDYRMNGLEWYTTLDDFHLYADYSETEIIDGVGGNVTVKTPESTYIYYKNVPFEPQYTFSEGRLVTGYYIAKMAGLKDYISVTDSLLNVVTSDLPEPSVGSTETLKVTPKSGDDSNDILWIGDDDSQLMITVENNTDIRQDPHYIILLEVAAP